MEKHIRQLTPEQDALGHIVACRDKPFLEERFIDSFKGRGVFTHKAIKPSSFVVEYRGNIFSHEDTTPKKKCGDTLNNYLFEFLWRGAHWCIDASKEDGTLGRLVNDDHMSPNCEMKTVVCEGKPHLCLFAVKEISRGEEITYNYGDSSYPWRSRESYDGSSTSFTDVYATSLTSRAARLEYSAASCFEKSCSDHDELPESGPSCDNDITNINSQPDFRDNSAFADLDSSQEMMGTFMLQPDDASCSQQENEAAFSSDNLDWDEDYRPSKAVRKKPRNSSYTCKNYCYVCGVGFAKLARHFLRHADEEPEIVKVLAFPKKSKERIRLLNDLRNRGNYKHNQEVLKNNSGELKLKRRTTTAFVSTKTHVHCLYCKGMFKRKEMWRHVARCPSRTTPSFTTGGKTRVLSEIGLAESPFSQKLPSGVWKMFLAMNQDEIAFAVQNDFLLIQLAQYLCEKYGSSSSKQEYIRQKLREMGRLLLALHEKSIFSFEDAIKPRNFYKVVEAVKDIAGFNKKMQSYNRPGLALKLGHSLKKVGAIVLTKVDGNEERMRETKTFMKLCAKEWIELVSQTALASLNGRKVNNPSTIPFTRDMQVFYMYLETTSAVAIENLTMDESPQVYQVLCRVTLAQASVLNKCAPEVSKLTLKTFQQRDDATQVLSKHFIRINILSRTGKNIPVLLTSELVSALTLLVSKRKACDVHQDNPFLFARPNSSPTSLYHGRNCIRAFSSLCRAKNPEHLRSVHLHKHIARVFQILNLENDELDHLAKLLGHDIRADRDYYRLPEAAVELAKVAKLLLAMEKGSLERFKGNSLEEVEIEDELEPDAEQVNPENSESEEDNEESDLPRLQSDAVEAQGRQLTPEQEALEHIKARRDKGFLKEMFIDPLKGRGVFTHESIGPSTFVVEYRGTLSPLTDTRRKKCGDTLKNFLFEFSWNGTNWRVDASKEDGTLGRLVNDDHMSPNCEMKTVVCEGKPHLCLFAVKEISRGEEITYNYGDSSYPWRSRESNTSQRDLHAAGSSQADQSVDHQVEDSAGASSCAESCSDDEYVPDGEPSSDDSSGSNSNQERPNVKKNPDPDSSERPSFVPQPADASCVRQEDEGDDNSRDFTSDEEPEGTPGASKNFCYVCGKAQTKISRHLFTHRKEEADVAEVFALPLYSKERNRLLEKLRNRGNYKHNEKVLTTQRGELKVRKRKSNMSTTAKTYALCLYCKGMYIRKEMWRHMQNCSSKKSLKVATRGKTKVLTLVTAAESTDPKRTPLDARKILKKMKKDEIASVVWSDPHIQLLAQCLCYMNESNVKKHEHITHKLRLMGRLLITLKKKSISSIEDAIKPQSFSKVVEAVRELAGFNEETKTFDRPSVMAKLGNLLKKTGDINFARALKQDADKQTIDEAETFMKLCAKEWIHVRPSTPGGSNPATIAFTRDVQLLYQCTEKTAASAVESLTMYESPQVYNALLRVTAAQVAVLNRNVEDVSKVTLASFKERVETDAAGCQSQLEQILSKHSVKIHVRNNRGKKLTVALTPELLAAITLLADKREACGVHKNNRFLFARPVAFCASFHHVHQGLRTFVARCGAKNAANLRSVSFRKYVARVFQILGLTSDELDQLAKVLPCGIRTDSQYYQMPEAAVDVAKISELLSAMENGSLERFEGKSLEEIEIADELEPDVEQDEPQNSDAEEEKMGGDLQKGTDVAQDKATTSKGNAKASLAVTHETYSNMSTTQTDISTSHQRNAGRSSFSTNKKPSRYSRVSSWRKRGRGKRKESESDTSELNDEENDEANTEKDVGSEETPVSCSVNTPEETPSRSNEDICLSDDMNVDFDMDVDSDEDVVGNRGKDGDGDTNGSTATVKDVAKQDDDISDAEKNDGSHNTDPEETMNHVEQEGGQEKKNKRSAAAAGMKEVKILIPKLNIEKLQASLHVSQFSSVCKDQRDDNNKRPSSSTATDIRSMPTCAKVIQMSCSHCKKTMMKGQTAYQKKGFTDVFCSKNCLFQMFSINKAVTKSCHYCLKAISQPLDLIMAAVDVKGTMKDFCSVTCLTSFKSNTVSTQSPSSICTVCSKSCTTTHELTVNEAVHKFCSESCLEGFRRDNMADCENCSSSCHKPLVLQLAEETKTICSEKCLAKFKEVLKCQNDGLLN